MDIDRPSLAAAALYELKNEQLELANAALQQQTSNERNQQTHMKQQENSYQSTSYDSCWNTTICRRRLENVSSKD